MFFEQRSSCIFHFHNDNFYQKRNIIFSIKGITMEDTDGEPPNETLLWELRQTTLRLMVHVNLLQCCSKKVMSHFQCL